jgi:hypothetical protein
VIVATEQQSWIEGEATPAGTRFENKLAWVPSRGGKMIIAVGGPAQWRSTQPLPPEAVVKDLVSTSLPALAISLWAPFLAYISHGARQKGWRNAFSGLLRTQVAVRLDIKDVGVRLAVKSAIEKARFGLQRFVCE